jgi:single-strand DNA-binding protein
MSLNKVSLIGLVGKEPDIRTTQDGKEVASFSLATTESWKDKNTGEKKDKTEWHRIVVFGALAGIVKNYVKKGSKLYVEGQLKTREWTDKDGIKKYTTEIVLQGFNSTLLMLGGKNNNAPQDQLNKDMNKVEEAFDNQELDDEIPF